MSDARRAPDELIGKTIAGRYRIISRLGAGGMGVAYRAWDEHAGRPVVIKIPKREFLEDPTFRERFNREIRLLQKLRHPHIVPLVDVGEHEGLPFLVMPFLPGGSLSDRRLRDDDRRPRPNPPGMLHLWLPGVAEALDFIHANGIVHRDVKPANIFFDAFWGPFVGDFGIAKILAESDTFDKEATLTGTNMGIGTADYMASEQLTPKPVLDGRADQYALAVIAYEMLAGTRPFTGATTHIAVEILTQQPPRLDRQRTGLPGSLVQAVHRGLAKQAAKRFATCREFAAAVLRDVAPLADEPDVARLLCPSCSNLLKLPVSAGGQQGKCPKCKEEMEVAEDLGALWLLDEARRQRRSQATVVDVEDIEDDQESVETGSEIDEDALEAFKPVSSTTPIERAVRKTSAAQSPGQRLAAFLAVGGLSLLGALLINPLALTHPETGPVGRLLGPGLAEAVGWSLTAVLLLAFLVMLPFVGVAHKSRLPANDEDTTPAAGRAWVWKGLMLSGGIAAVWVLGLVLAFVAPQFFSRISRDDPPAKEDIMSLFDTALVALGEGLGELESERLAAAYAKLKLEPQDPAANDLLGRHWCFKREDWNTGLPYLAKSDSVLVADTAKKQLDLKSASAATEAGNTVRLAQSWWTLSGQKGSISADEAKAIKKHAAAIYMAAVDGLTDSKDIEETNLWLDQNPEFLKLAEDKRPPKLKPRFPEGAIAFKGHTYFFPGDQTNQIEARLAAEKLGGGLVVIDDADENAFIAKNVHGPTWIGIGKFEHSWVHLAGGVRATFFAWDGGQPSNGPGEVAASTNPAGLWHDHFGTDDLFYVVEWPEASNATTPGKPSPTPPVRESTDKKAQEILARLPLENSVGMKLKLIPPGTFMMGSEDGEAYEKPVHEVRITKPFYLGVYEVTNAQWKVVMGGEPPSRWREDDRPVEQASWDDAVEFCRKLSELHEERTARRTYRLPTEAEWEYACRAGTTSRWASGDDEKMLRDVAWFASNSKGHTHLVGQKKANPWGLHDMHGNVWEWCSDWHGPYAAGVATNTTGPDKGSGRVRRGGSWGGIASVCRSAVRDWDEPSSRSDYLGFRLALSLSESGQPEAGK